MVEYEVERARRLVLARVFALPTVAAAQAYSAACAAEIGSAVGGRPILLADHRAVRLYPPDVTDALCAVFRINNALIERIAILVSPSNATLHMQLQRITREAGGDVRRVFTRAAEATEFLEPSLSPSERGEVATFFDAQ